MWSLSSVLPIFGLKAYGQITTKNENAYWKNFLIKNLVLPQNDGKLCLVMHWEHTKGVYISICCQLLPGFSFKAPQTSPSTCPNTSMLKEDLYERTACAPELSARRLRIACLPLLQGAFLYKEVFAFKRKRPHFTECLPGSRRGFDPCIESGLSSPGYRQHRTPRHCFPVHEQKLLAAAEEFPCLV
ncbi:uncharacterized protein AAGF69_010643 isoform 1-T7 [Amazona ochrocephala]